MAGQPNYIPQGGINPAQLLMQFQQFKKDYYANNPNPDPKSACMQVIQENGIDPSVVNAGLGLAQQLGFK